MAAVPLLKVMVASPLPMPSPNVTEVTASSLAYPISLNVTSELPAPGTGVAKTAWKVLVVLAANVPMRFCNSEAVVYTWFLVGLVSVLQPMNLSAQQPSSSFVGVYGIEVNGFVISTVVLATSAAFTFHVTTH